MLSAPNEEHQTDTTLIIAEVGSVHDGSFGNAKRLIEIASECGADVVKFQTHIAAAETLPDAPMPSYFKGEPRYEYFERTAFSLEQLQTLKLHCDQHQVEFMSSPFSVEAVELLETVGVQRYKIPSGEVTNLSLLEAVAQTKKAVIISSGMSSWQELDAAVNTILPHNEALTVLQCTSEYPCAYENVGLNIMVEMKQRYGLPVGLSDHTMTIVASLAATVLGASVIEKHFAFSRHMYGSDAQHSLEPAELKALVSGVRAIDTMMASQVDKDDIDQFSEMKSIFEKSIVSLIDMPAGTVIEPNMVGLRKPGTGMPPRHLKGILGKRTLKDIPKNSLIAEKDLSD